MTLDSFRKNLRPEQVVVANDRRNNRVYTCKAKTLQPCFACSKRISRFVDNVAKRVDRRINALEEHGNTFDPGLKLLLRHSGNVLERQSLLEPLVIFLKLADHSIAVTLPNLVANNSRLRLTDPVCKPVCPICCLVLVIETKPARRRHLHCRRTTDAFSNIEILLRTEIPGSLVARRCSLSCRAGRRGPWRSCGNLLHDVREEVEHVSLERRRGSVNVSQKSGKKLSSKIGVIEGKDLERVFKKVYDFFVSAVKIICNAGRNIWLALR